jgi:hypothetical protein
MVAGAGAGAAGDLAAVLRGKQLLGLAEGVVADDRRVDNLLGEDPLVVIAVCPLWESRTAGPRSSGSQTTRGGKPGGDGGHLAAAAEHPGVHITVDGIPEAQP